MRALSTDKPSSELGDIWQLCPCGNYDPVFPRRHAAWHTAWSIGPPFPARLDFLSDGPAVVVVRLTSPGPWRRFAYEMSCYPQRSEGYDFASFPPPLGRAEDDEAHSRALIYVYKHHAIGYASVADLPVATRWRIGDADTEKTGTRRMRPVLGPIFTAHLWRRKGIASALVRAAAADSGCEPEQLAWCVPFTAEGKSLAKRFADDQGQVWIG